ncbi:MAG: InlB B-repeat-containing protein [Prevotella sp.]|nr:InlB B-repeat-containing protein [Prevotella sp.]
MKKFFTQTFATLLLTTLALSTTQQVRAQDDVDVVGYVNTFIKVKAVPQGGGQVFPFYQETNIKVWRDEWDFKQPVPVGSMMDTYFTMLYLYAKPSLDAGYTFAGWYLDDGDGEFDMDKDQLLSDKEEYLNLMAIDDGTSVYATQAEARAGAFPSEPTDVVFAYFSRGARVALSYYQDDYLDLHANCGTVWISKKVNEPGDEVTVRAIANDGYHFEYWQDASEMGNIISRENPYTFTVKGGECLYAYFTADDAPSLTLPEEGGFAVLNTDEYWFLSDESILNGAHVLVMTADDMRRDADGRVYLDMDVEECHLDVAQKEEATIVYGKGEVRFSIHLLNVGFKRSHNDLVQWSGKTGISLSGDVIYVYVFVPELGAFIQYGTTDDYSPKATPTVSVPAGVAYFSMSAFDLTDDQGHIPSVIGFSPETYDSGVAEGETALEKLLGKLAGVEGMQLNTATLRGQHVYTLSGVEVNTTPERGVYIVNGRKVVLK